MGSLSLDWMKVSQIETNCASCSFWKSLGLWVLRPHLVNKEWSGADVFTLGDQNPLSIYSELRKVVEDDKVLGYRDLYKCVSNITGKYSHHVGPLIKEVLVRVLIHKSADYQPESSIELVIYDYSLEDATFITVRPQSFAAGYKITFDGSSICLSTSPDYSSHDLKWLKNVLPKTLATWATSSSANESLPSLSLISNMLYFDKYQYLKEKYGTSLCQAWEESTDPKKFVYEDIAIAAYLIVLWGDKKQRFVDLGCGNGLLVYLLIGEGHSGIGIDVRARKIWSKYPGNVVLQECAYVPSSDNLFPMTDWIIGNHSDELTPWIPVIAAKSSPFCNFFLLPCCAYEFSGQKYRRKNTSISVYRDYLNYVSSIISFCGFQFDMDRMRIPSTKRTCFVSKGRIGAFENNTFENSLDGFHFNGVDNGSLDRCHFVPRGSKEKVRNCTQLERSLVQEIVQRTSKLIIDTFSQPDWNEGSPIPLSQVIKIIPPDKLSALKKECGGLQTLLRNHHHIFQIKEGSVSFRKPIPKSKESCKAWKTKPCWFYSNHPQLCPLKDDECSFTHVLSS